LTFFPAPGLRPTPDRVRETLFNWLAPVIRESRCLDLFAGSGALGIEAASRGAADVVLVEDNPRVVECLREQLRIFKATQVQAVQANVLSYLATAPRVFDIVFLDPPFRAGRLPECVHLLETNGWLAAEAWIYLEAEHGLVLDLPEHWELYRSRQAGQVDYHLARRAQAS
jgi:16S rRNA (guanine966-N2)-methyltransferase